jgi:hypothetical protein
MRSATFCERLILRGSTLDTTALTLSIPLDTRPTNPRKESAFGKRPVSPLLDLPSEPTLLESSILDVNCHTAAAAVPGKFQKEPQTNGTRSHLFTLSPALNPSSLMLLLRNRFALYGELFEFENALNLAHRCGYVRLHPMPPLYGKVKG